MKIINLLYSKYCLSFSICLISSIVIFFIFSLIGNLNEDYYFRTIINISIVNSFQILIHVSAFIFLLSVILLLIFLRSKNEKIIIKSYLSFKKIIIFFIPIILFFTFLEINKNSLGLIIDEFKENLIDRNSNAIVKIIIKKSDKTQTFTVFNNINGKNLESTEFRFYKVFNKEIIDAQYSDNLELLDNKLIANSHTKYNKNIIKDIKTKKIFDINFLDLIDNNLIVKDLSEKKYFFSMLQINLLVFYILLFSYIFLIFFNRKFVNNKQSLIIPILVCLLFIIYSFLIFSNSFTTYKQLFELLACIIIFISTLKLSFNE